MTDTRTFPLADVLSITTPNLLSRRHMDGIIDLVNWLRGTTFTYDGRQFSAIADGLDLRTEARACRPVLLRQHPWLVHTEQQHGDTVDVTRAAP